MNGLFGIKEIELEAGLIPRRKQRWKDGWSSGTQSIVLG